VLGEPENRTYHTHVVRELGHKQARALLSDVEASNARNRAALFAHLVKNAKRR
jgi:thiamine monophosphate kinase